MKRHDRCEGKDDHEGAYSKERADDRLGEGFDLKLSDLDEDLEKKKNESQRQPPRIEEWMERRTNSIESSAEETGREESTCCPEDVHPNCKRERKQSQRRRSSRRDVRRKERGLTKT